VRTPGLIAVLLFASAAVRGQAHLSPEHAEVLAIVKQNALDYIKRLPDYTCTQVTTRRTTPVRLVAQWTRPDVIEEQLTFSNRHESYQVVAINGQKVTGVEHSQISGAISQGEFGSLLYKIVAPESHTDFAFSGMATVHGRKVIQFAYEVPQSMGYRLFHASSPLLVFAGLKGTLYADAETKQVIRVTMQCIGLPADFPIKEVGLTLDYKTVSVGGQEYSLPVHSEMHLRDTTNEVKTEIEYTRYGKFVSDSKLTFGDGGKPVQ
jgi:hypothetical protein